MSVIARRAQKQRLFVGAASVLVLASLLSFSLAVPGEASSKVSTTGSTKQKAVTESTVTTVPVVQETVVVANESNVDKDGDGTVDYYKKGYDTNGDGVVDTYNRGKDNCGDRWSKNDDRNANSNASGNSDNRRDGKHQKGDQYRSVNRSDNKHQGGGYSRSGNGSRHGGGKYGK